MTNAPNAWSATIWLRQCAAVRGASVVGAVESSYWTLVAPGAPKRFKIASVVSCDRRRSSGARPGRPVGRSRERPNFEQEEIKNTHEHHYMEIFPLREGRATTNESGYDAVLSIAGVRRLRYRTRIVVSRGGIEPPTP
jgi:hypothetical protein